MVDVRAVGGFTTTLLGAAGASGEPSVAPGLELLPSAATLMTITAKAPTTTSEAAPRGLPTRGGRWRTSTGVCPAPTPPPRFGRPLTRRCRPEGESPSWDAATFLSYSFTVGVAEQTDPEVRRATGPMLARTDYLCRPTIPRLMSDRDRGCIEGDETPPLGKRGRHRIPRAERSTDVGTSRTVAPSQRDRLGLGSDEAACLPPPRPIARYRSSEGGYRRVHAIRHAGGPTSVSGTDESKPPPVITKRVTASARPWPCKQVAFGPGNHRFGTAVLGAPTNSSPNVAESVQTP